VKTNRFPSLFFAMRFPLYIFGLWLVGFLIFAAQLPDTVDVYDVQRSEAIVVLTGGAGRIEAGAQLLQSEVGERMLISGVGHAVTLDALDSLSPLSILQKECCVDLDHLARNTQGNAWQTKAWLRDQQFESLILVTADYHMPRSLLVFENALPDAFISPFPVDADVSIGYLMMEYNKFLITYFRQAF